MRNVVYKDTKIKDKDYQQVISDYSAFIKKHTGITPTFVTLDYDFTDYPTLLDTDGDDVMRPNFLHELSDDVTRRYGDYGTDNIITLIHQDNWKSGKTKDRKGIWGTNLSYKHGNYHIQYCRFDSKNLANSFGTINHEQDHTYDALIKVEIGIDINPILGVKSYDAETTHGGTPPHKYIRYQENASKLKILSPYLIASYKKRLEKNIVQKQFTIIGLLEWLVDYYQKQVNSKNGIKIK